MYRWDVAKEAAVDRILVSHTSPETHHQNSGALVSVQEPR